MRKLLVMITVVGALAFPASAFALDFQLRGVEVRVTPATFVGLVSQSGSRVGTFYTEVPHSLLLPTGATICPSGSPCGVYVFSTSAGKFAGRLLGGTISAATTVPDNDGCPDEEFTVDAELTSGGSAHVTLHHFNKFQFFGCPTIAASVQGTVTDP